MTASPTILSPRRIACAAVLALTLAAGALPAGPALARRACASARAARPRVGSPRLAGARAVRSRRSASARGAGACARTRAGAGRGGHARRHPRRAHRRRPSAASPALPRSAPRCEDGSVAAAPAGAGPPTCADGSEPACQAGSDPVANGGGAVLYCTPDPEAEGEFESSCEAGTGSGCTTPPAPEGPTVTPCTGTPAQLDGEGDFACGDGGEPVCPEGYVLSVSPDGSTLMCSAGEAEAPGPGRRSAQPPAGTSVHVATSS